MTHLRTSSRKLVPLALAVFLLLLLPATRAHASNTQVSMFQDDPAIESNPQYVLSQVRLLGGTMVKVWLNWAQVAPKRLSRKAPRGFNAADPAAYPAGNWRIFDTIVRDAAAQGIGVNFDIGIQAPIWATAPGAPRDGQVHFNWKPSPTAYAAFVRAAGKRYSGSFRPRGALSPLPRVSFWSIWNEPNLGFELAPQGVPGHLTIENSGNLYRGLLEAGWTALHQTGHGRDTILIGDLGPRGSSTGFGVFSSMNPLQFLRALYCVDSRYRQLRGYAAAIRGCPTTAAASRRFRAQNPGLFSASGIADHMWSRWYPPTSEGPHGPDFFGLPDVPHAESVLDRLQRVYGSHKKFSIYNTEYGYITDPPNPDVGYPEDPFPSPATAAGWLNWAEYLEWRNPRMQSFSQYVLTDSGSNQHPYVGWSSGLITYTGEQKPTYSAWRMPLYLPKTSTWPGGSLEVWGCLRPAAYAIVDTGQPQTAQIQFRPSGTSDFTTVATATITSQNSCYFDEHIQFPGSGTVRVQWNYPAGDPLLGSPDPTATPAPLYSRSVDITVQ